MPALLFDFLRHRVRQRVRGRVAHGLVAEATDAVELGLLEPVEQRLKVLLGLAGEADDERRADGELGDRGAPLADPLQRLRLGGGPLHRFQDLRARVLERHVEIRQQLARGHQRDQLVDVRIRIHVVQAHPRAELAECRGEIRHARGDLAAAPLGLRVAHVDAVRARVLRDHEQLLDACAHEPLGFPQDVAGRSAPKIAAQARDDAEGAAVIAALGDLQIRVVPRRELDALRRDEIDERIVRRRQHGVHGAHHGLVLMRPRDRDHVRVRGADRVGLRAEAARHDHAAVLRERLADRVERFLARAVQEAAGVHDDDVCARVVGRGLVPFRAELAQDPLGIDERLRAAEAHEADFRGAGLGHGLLARKGALLRHAAPRNATSGARSQALRGPAQRPQSQAGAHGTRGVRGPGAGATHEAPTMAGTVTREQLDRMVGQRLGVSDWFAIDQERVNRFADVTVDHQFIHVDAERAKATPFGGTIAHGFLTLSLLVPLCLDFIPVLANRKLVVNYGFDKVRFVAPVRVGKRVRAQSTLAEVAERKPGNVIMQIDVTVEIEKEDKPALVAEWLSMHVVG